METLFTKNKLNTMFGQDNKTLTLEKLAVFQKVIFFITALVTGSLLPFAFAPFNFWSLSILCLTLLLFLWQDSRVSPKIAFWLGFCFGLGMYGFGVSWVFVSIHQYGGTEKPLAAFITFLLILLMSLFPALNGYLLKRFFRGNRIQFLLLGFPSSWVLMEWIRSIAFTGFPWLLLGYTQLDTPLRGYAPIGSVYLVSFVLLVTAGAITLLFKGKSKEKSLAFLLLIIIWGLGAFLTSIKWTLPFNRVHTVSLIQGNVPLLQKFTAKDPLVAVNAIYGTMTEPHLGEDLILWPESAITVPLPYSKAYIDYLSKKLKEAGSTLITGIQVTFDKNQYYNSLISIGNGSGIYHKHHLLPYGDYLPFDKYLRGLISFFDLPMSSFLPGSSDQPLIQAGLLKLNPQICYEIAFPEQIRQSLRDANAIVTLSEDGWFGDSFGPHQHLQIARMRAVETKRPVLRATTSGITAIIDENGDIKAKAPQFQPFVLSGNFQPMQGQTPWIYLGLWPFLILWLLMFILPSKNKKENTL